MKTYSIGDTDYCDATLNERPITGWIIRRHGEPAYFHIEGRDGLCVRIDQVSNVRPVEL